MINKNYLKEVKKIDSHYSLFKCVCGKMKKIQRSGVNNGSTKSCGCYRKHYMSIKQKNNIKHGMCHTRFYNIYKHIKRRCYNKNCKEYENYGKRGVTCVWKNFNDFKEHMYDSYILHCNKFGKKNTSIDRIDNNGNYCQKNCKWSTRKEQQRNKRDNKLITYKDRTEPIIYWAEKFNIKYTTLQSRLSSGWDIERALTDPVKQYYFD